MREHDGGDTSVLTALFAHNTWANLKLLDFCERLSDAQLDSAAIGGFGSIRDTLLHIVGAEVSYVNRTNGRLPAQGFDRDVFPGFATLKDAARWAGDELLQIAISARKGTLVRQYAPRDPAEYPLASLIVQSINHSTEHRTQIATIITQLGQEPPDMSGWQYMDEAGELRDLAPGAAEA